MSLRSRILAAHSLARLNARLRQIALSGVGLFIVLGQSLAQESALEIIRKSEALVRGTTLIGSYRLTIQRPGWQRVLEFDTWIERTERAFIRIKSPAKERGVAFLKLRREMWQYVPRINRVIKIPPSMMMQSWMGSGFTNDDLVRESSLEMDYVHTLLGEERLPLGQAWKIELATKPEALIAWDRMLYWVRQQDFVPLKAEFYNERGERVRTITYSEIREMNGRVVPSRLELVEDRWPDRKTILETSAASFDVRIDPSVYTQANLRRPP